MASMQLGGGIAKLSQSSLQYSPFFTPYRYRVLANPLLVMVAALPPPVDEASVAAIWIEIGHRALDMATGKSNAAQASSSLIW